MLAVPQAIAAIIGGLLGTVLAWPAIGAPALLVFPVTGSLSALVAGWTLHASDVREADVDLPAADPSEMVRALRAVARSGRGGLPAIDPETIDRKAG